MNRHFCLPFYLFPLLIIALEPCLGAEPEQTKLEFFEKKIRPVLAENCFKCHSATAKKLKAGLQLDHGTHILTGGESGPAVVAGDANASLLIESISYQNQDLEMPPKEALSVEVVADFRKWVSDGAVWPDEEVPLLKGEALTAKFDLGKRQAEHWSWKSVQNPTPPKIKIAEWQESPIDQFILSRMEEAGLRPAIPAEKRVWLRRIYFDLTGLPPSAKDIDAFLQDQKSGADGRVVDKLLASPGFGEKWARHWMDLVRYADTYGHEFDYPIRFAHEYRDYLIRAFNADVPYDLFIKEHIAGDLITSPRRNQKEDFNESVLGTGFWFLHEATHAPTDVRADECDHIDNQLDVFGKAFLGLTVSCARCHDHKFDAISTEDYYSLSSYLQSSLRDEVSMDPGRIREKTATQQLKLLKDAEDFLEISPNEIIQQNRPGIPLAIAIGLVRSKQNSDSEIKAAAKKHGLSFDILRQWCKLCSKQYADKKGNDLKRPGAWLSAWIKEPELARSELKKGKQLFSKDKNFFADFQDSRLPPDWSHSGNYFRGTPRTFSFGKGGFLAYPNSIDGTLPGDKFSGVLRSPLFEITTEKIHVRIKSDRLFMRVVMDNYQMAQFSGLLFKDTTLKNVDTGGNFQWITFGGDLKKYIGHMAYLEFVDQGSGSVVVDKIVFSNDPAPTSSFHALTEILVGETFPETAQEISRRLDTAWTGAISEMRKGSPSPESSEVLNWLEQNKLINLSRVFGKKFANTIKKGREISGNLPDERFAIAMAEGTPENSYVHVRGSYRMAGKETPPRFLTALGGKKGNRLALAEQMTASANPLTSRVIVNRLWHHLFGRGIVPTTDDFGPMGQMPSHPELLDWLATDLMENKWSLKHTIREIVLSQTYRQSSVRHPQLSPSLIAEKDPTNRLLHRMPIKRLTAEAIRDGILAVSGQLNSKMYGPGIPTFRTAFMTGRGGKKSGPLDGDGRRTIYGAVYRNFLSPLLLTFDMPGPFGPKGRRSVSNVPAQALSLMNDPFVIEQSKHWAAKILAQDNEGKNQKISHMFETALGKPADAGQIKKLSLFLDEQAKIYGKLDQRAWTDLAHVLFNMKEFIYLE